MLHFPIYAATKCCNLDKKNIFESGGGVKWILVVLYTPATIDLTMNFRVIPFLCLKDLDALSFQACGYFVQIYFSPTDDHSMFYKTLITF